MHKTKGFDAGEALKFLIRADRKLAKLIEEVPFTLGVERRQSPFHALLRSIVYQQLSGKAAASIHHKVKSLYPGRRVLLPEELLGTPDKILRSAGLSFSKIAAIKDLSKKTLDGHVPSMARIKRMTDEEIIERLVEIRGIGPWTVEMFLIFNLGRPDVLPCTDYGVRKGFALAYKKKELPTPKELLAFGERWRPYRTVASWYMWRALEL